MANLNKVLLIGRLTADPELRRTPNDIPVATGQVVLRGDRIGITITEVLFRAPGYRPRDNVRLL